MEPEVYLRHLKNEESHWWFKGRRKIIHSIIEKKFNFKEEKLNIIDIGSGSGTNIKMLSSFGNVFAYEKNKSIADILKNKFKSSENIKIVNSFENENFYDLIIAADVIEHIEDDKDIIWERAIENNLTNAYKFIEALLPKFNNTEIGRIILISSLAYRRGAFDHIPYTASKGGITGLVRAYSRKLAPKILVNGLAPGIINTKMPQDLIKERGDELIKQIPQKRFGEPEEVANVILFLLSHYSSYVNGQIINIDGGIINS